MATGRLAIDVSSIPAKPAGAGKYGIELVSHLKGLTDSIDLVTKRRDSDFWRELSNGKVILESPDFRAMRIAWETSLLGAKLNARGVGLYHGIHYTIPRGYSGKVVVTVHDLTMVDHPEWHERSKVVYFSAAIRRAVERADSIVVPSQFTRRRLQHHFGVLTNVVVVPHGVDHQRFKPRQGGAWRGSNMKLPSTYILHIGTIEPRKNLESLVRAFDVVASDNSQVELVLVGQKGWKSDAIYSAIASSRYKDRINIYGYLSEDCLREAMSRASCVAYPSFAEGFGLPVLEAMASGVPVVTSRDSSMEEVTAGFAWLCDPFDVRDIAAAITSAMSDEDGTRVSKALERSMDFDWSYTAVRHLEVYKALGLREES